MKHNYFAGIALAVSLFAGSAQATDILAQPTNWSGPYVGANIGYSWGPWRSTGVLVGPAGTASPNVNGILGGLQAGYNWQKDSWFWGIEGDIQITGEKDTIGWTALGQVGAVPVGNTVRNEWRFPWFGTLRARAGLANDDWLAYITGGLAFGHAEYKFTNLTTGAVLKDDATRAGWTLGAGAERALDPDWSAKLEYLYVDLGRETFLAGTATPVRTNIRDHILRIGVNRRFSTGY
ncbi:MAG: porin family protein [Rhodobiaceae bacterium]|nr:porin family protein [Rhodobiaceae bacterium]